MSTIIFVSHAGADWSRVAEVARLLRAAQLEVRLDRDELKQGDSFLSFMEDALEECDYCVLLWSAAASKSKWVRVEWEAAFHRTIEKSQSFLIIGRLEDYPVPELLRPRLRTDLFPDPNLGVTELIEMWQHDQTASIESARPVGNPICPIQDDSEGKTVYVSSQLFGKTYPLRVQLNVPVAVIVEQVVSMLGIPRQWDHEGRLGVRFIYELAHQERTLQPGQPLGSQGVTENDLLWLQTTMQPFGSSEPVHGALGNATFRGGEQNNWMRLAQQQLLTRISEVGLGF